MSEHCSKCCEMAKVIVDLKDENVRLRAMAKASRGIANDPSEADWERFYGALDALDAKEGDNG